MGVAGPAVRRPIRRPEELLFLLGLLTVAEIAASWLPGQPNVRSGTFSVWWFLVATALNIVILVLLWVGSRFVWVFGAVASASYLLGLLIHPHATAKWFLYTAFVVSELLVLVSRPMRAFVWRPRGASAGV